ncbi:hypothetical protein BDP55DRAFT_656 [Colletotrichum godetiae]|uniref:Uncharacterized protein n=1 Tax=Colletotrichum godetiae TaxID=1209918 RepID=A0AAJ0AZR5_9PEZI|nr:uncharacterized protein BDP55DRAFT_656 [Colletotrichum godetiae]KAK1700813.1 hypothetical protein BDP55DRAFT_656 [Colletotrichum godetiae]
MAEIKCSTSACRVLLNGQRPCIWQSEQKSHSTRETTSGVSSHGVDKRKILHNPSHRLRSFSGPAVRFGMPHVRVSSDGWKFSRRGLKQQTKNLRPCAFHPNRNILGSALTITTEEDDGALEMQAASLGSECDELNRDGCCGWPGWRLGRERSLRWQSVTGVRDESQWLRRNQTLGGGPALLPSRVSVDYGATVCDGRLTVPFPRWITRVSTVRFTFCTVEWIPAVARWCRHGPLDACAVQQVRWAATNTGPNSTSLVAASFPVSVLRSKKVAGAMLSRASLATANRGGSFSPR